MTGEQEDEKRSEIKGRTGTDSRSDNVTHKCIHDRTVCDWHTDC